MEQKCQQCVIRDLNSLNKAKPEDLTDINNHKKSLYFKKGESIFTEGKSLKGVYCLRNGNCKLTKLAPNGKEQIVRFIQKGELVVTPVSTGLGTCVNVCESPTVIQAVSHAK